MTDNTSRLGVQITARHVPRKQLRPSQSIIDDPSPRRLVPDATLLEYWQSHVDPIHYTPFILLTHMEPNVFSMANNRVYSISRGFVIQMTDYLLYCYRCGPRTDYEMNRE